MAKIRSDVYDSGVGSAGASSKPNVPSITVTTTLGEGLDEQVEGLSSALGEKSTLIGQFQDLTHINEVDATIRKQAAFYISADALVMAYKKKRFSRSKWVVQTCFTLANLEILSDSDNSHNSDDEVDLLLKMQYFSETFLFRFGSADKKAAFLAMYKKTKEELMMKLNDDLLVRDNDRDIVIHSDPASYTKSINDISVGPLLSNMNYRTMKIPQETNNPELAWLRDMPEELDVFIAHREFDKAIQCVERARAVFNNYGNGSYFMSLLNKQLQQKVDTLSDLLTKDLKNPYIPSSTAHVAITRLSKLGLGTKARDLFLETKSKIIKTKLMSLPFEGDILSYIHDLTFLFFSLLKKIIKQYKQYFDKSAASSSLTSGLISWLNEELSLYWKRFRCQVFYEDQDFGVISECLLSAREGCWVLRDVGVEVSHVFDMGMVRDDVINSLEWLRARTCAEISKYLADDDVSEYAQCYGVSLSLKNEKSKNLEFKSAKLTSSASAFVKTVLQFILVEVQPLLDPQTSSSYYLETTNSISSFFELYFRHQLDVCNRGFMSDKSVLICVSNLSFLAQEFFPFVRSLLETIGIVPEQFVRQRYERRHPLETIALQNSSGIKKSKRMISEERLAAEALKEPLYIGFNRLIPEWTKLQKRLEAINSVIISSFSIRRAKDLAKASYAFGPASVLSSASKMQFMDYSSDAYPLEEKLNPNESIIICLRELKVLENTLKETLKSNDRKVPGLEKVANDVVDCFIRDIMDETNWVTQEHGYDRVFKYTGLHQFILDIHFFLKHADVYLADQSIQLANEACSKALKLYFKRCNNEDERKRVLKNAEWFDKRILEITKTKNLSDLTLAGLDA